MPAADLGTTLSTLDAFAPLAGNMIDTGLQAGLGAYQLLYANKLKRQANALFPTSVDPQEQQYNQELNSIRKGSYSGASYANAIRSLRTQQMNSGRDIVAKAGGYGGGAIAGLALNAGEADDAYGKIASTLSHDLMGYQQMYGASTNSMVKRRADLDMMKYGQAEADYREDKAAGYSNFFGATAGKGIQDVNFKNIATALTANKRPPVQGEDYGIADDGTQPPVMNAPMQSYGTEADNMQSPYAAYNPYH
jgi:hypothetical protein